MADSNSNSYIFTERLDLQINKDEYITDSSDILEYDKMIENMKKELLLCKLKLNYLERLVSYMIIKSYD